VKAGQDSRFARLGDPGAEMSAGAAVARLAGAAPGRVGGIERSTPFAVL
jgi:hypothetical protein